MSDIKENRFEVYLDDYGHPCVNLPRDMDAGTILKVFYTPTRKERPSMCRNRLKAEGKPYPKSGCYECGDGGMRGCPYG